MPPLSAPDKNRRTNPLVSVVIVNLNGRRFIEDCFASLAAQTFRSFEVVFVDNGSTDGSTELVRERFPSAFIIKNSENFGFAKANNQGIGKSTGKYVLTLNNDTVLDAGFLETLVQTAEASSAETGMWAPKILSLSDKTSIDSVGGLLLYPDGIAKGRGRLEKDDGALDASIEAFIPSACAALYRKAMLDEVGLFDEDFFAYCEDTDLGLRARLAGWKALSVPRAIVYHYYSGTGGRYSELKAYLVERNRFWVAIKNFPLPRLFAMPYHTYWRYIVQIYGLITKKGAGGRFVENLSAFKLFSALLKAEFSALAGLPKMLAKRRVVQKLRKASPGEVDAWFKRYTISASALVLKD